MAAACGSTVDPNVDDGSCRQTYEFGNYGCARLVVIVDTPSITLPAARRWDIRAVPVPNVSGLAGGIDYEAKPGTRLLEFIRFNRLPTDTLNEFPAWVTARVIDDSRPFTSPLPVLAIDSVLHVFKFAPVGSRPVLDTVRLTPRRP